MAKQAPPNPSGPRSYTVRGEISEQTMFALRSQQNRIHEASASRPRPTMEQVVGMVLNQWAASLPQ